VGFHLKREREEEAIEGEYANKVAKEHKFDPIYYPCKNPSEENTVFGNLLTNQTYAAFSNYGIPSVLLLETQFTDILLQDESIFSERQKRNILSTITAVMLDMVPNEPQSMRDSSTHKARHFSVYECLKGNKPYLYNKCTPSDFKDLLDKHQIGGQRTLLEIFDKDD
jgi:hypothetical protein